MKVCPTCQRPYTRAKRTCASCDKPIKKRHKWRIDGSVIRHNNCLNPEMKPPEEGPLLAESNLEAQEGIAR